MTATVLPASRQAGASPPGPGESGAAAPAVARATSKPDRPLWMRAHHPGGRALVLEVGGAVDAASEPRLAVVLRQRLDSFAATLVLDLSAVTFLDSEGVMTLLDAAHYARIHAKPLVVITSPAVNRLLEILGLTDQFTCAHTVRAALSGNAKSVHPTIQC